MLSALVGINTFFSIQRRLRLPVSTASAAVGPATTATVEASATAAMKATTRGTVEAASSVETASRRAMESARAAIAANVAASTVTGSSIVAVTISPATMTVTPTTAPTTPAMSPTVPRTGANKHSPCEPGGPVVSVGCASVWSVSVIAVLTYRRSVRIAWPDANCHADLRL